MIVLIGSPRALASDAGTVEAVGDASAIGAAVATAGSVVQLVGRVGEDSAGDGVVLDLARRGVGHVAVLRDAGRPTPVATVLPDDLDRVDLPATAAAESSGLEAADVELALRYLPEYRVIVVAEPLDAGAMRVVVDAAGWSGAALVVAGRLPTGVSLPDGATVFEPPEDGDPDGAFAAMVGAYAAGLDRGDDPRVAFEAATAAVGSTVAAD
jgi:hypothetical protein